MRGPTVWTLPLKWPRFWIGGNIERCFPLMIHHLTLLANVLANIPNNNPEKKQVPPVSFRENHS